MGSVAGLGAALPSAPATLAPPAELPSPVPADGVPAPLPPTGAASGLHSSLSRLTKLRIWCFFCCSPMSLESRMIFICVRRSGRRARSRCISAMDSLLLLLLVVPTLPPPPPPPLLLLLLLLVGALLGVPMPTPTAPKGVPTGEDALDKPTDVSAPTPPSLPALPSHKRVQKRSKRLKVNNQLHSKVSVGRC